MIFERIFDFNTMQCCLITSAFFMSVVHKREHFFLRLFFCILIGLCFAPLIFVYQHNAVGPFIANPTTAFSKLIFIALNSTSTLFIYLTILTVIFIVCCYIDLHRAVYYAICAYLTQDFAYTIFVLIFPFAAHRGSQLINPSMLRYEILIFIGINIFIYFFLAKRFSSFYTEYFRYRAASVYMIIVLIISRVLGTYAAMLFNPNTHNMFRLILIYDTMLSAVLLLSQIMIYRQCAYQNRLSMEAKLRKEQFEQFESLKNSIDDIRHKSHDLKHIISALGNGENSSINNELLTNIETSILDYDSSIQTENNTLDAILGKYFHICKQHQIEWTCLADGKILDFIDDFDLFIMLGNAFDNAVENVCKINDIEKRFISVNIRKRNLFALITMKNYCSNNLEFKDNLPITTKDHSYEHGYGMKSISSIVDKYGGILSVSVDHDIFTLNILFPVNES